MDSDREMQEEQTRQRVVQLEELEAQVQREREAERQQRLAAGQCTKCGKPLGLIAKLMKKEAHGNCD